MKKLNLTEILEDNLPDSMSRILDDTTDSKVYIRSAMMDFGKQLLELAVDNVHIEKSALLWSTDGTLYPKSVGINTQSIIDTINQVEL